LQQKQVFKKISSFINTVCCGGISFKPELVKGIINDNLEIVDFDKSPTKPVF
jgi:hypothetical protein